MVMNEVRGEKVDIVPFSEDPPEFVMKALSPAKVKEVRIDESTGAAEVIVPDYQLSLAIGKEGQNARLAARLTGWRVDIKSESQLAEEEAGYAEEEWAEGEWVTNDTGEMVWKPADGSESLTADQWSSGEPGAEGEAPDAGEAATPAAEAPAADATPESGEPAAAAAEAEAPTPVTDGVPEAPLVEREAGA
jgi:N utilization substance protein A